MDNTNTLIERYVAGELSDAEFAELSRWLSESEANRALFLAQIDFYRTVTSSLVRQERDSAADDTIDRLVALDSDGSTAMLAIAAFAKQQEAIQGQPTDLQPDPPFSPHAPLHRKTKRHARLLLAGGIAAVIAISVLVALVVSLATQPQPTPVAQHQPAPEAIPVAIPVATLTSQQGAQWSLGSRKIGDKLHAGQSLTLTAGLAQITTQRGAIAILEAPCTIAFSDNPNALHLHTGKLVGICETESSKGFRVQTPQMDVTDLGTRFGVDVSRADATVVHVLQGKVEVARPGQDESRELTAGFALVARSGTSDLAGIDIDPARFDFVNEGLKKNGLAHARDRYTHIDHNGIASHTESVRLLEKPIDLDKLKDWPATDQLWVFEDLSPHRLTDAIDLTLQQPGEYSAFDEVNHPAPAGTVPAGTTIRSYIVLAHKSDAPYTRAIGSIRFEGEVLGLITNPRDQIQLMNAVGQAHPGLTAVPGRSLWADSQTLRGKDMVVLKEDRRSVDIKFRTNDQTDLIRIIVREPTGADPGAQP